ncbi:MAG: bifunctional cytidylyltransferase/SDR family oxidoreductase [Polyangiaceae bacterium]|nr:bifunctional cytidylyltransferase/SDR family oxidoreductase [Polyangiaceae bacterium]
MKNIAVILCGGKGVRFGSDVPKQFLKVAGKMVVEHTIDVFERSAFIDEICVVSNEEYIYKIEEIIIAAGYKKVKKVLTGGQERYDSSLSAIRSYREECNLIFHDAVRPLVSERIIQDTVQALEKYNAVDVAVRSTDTIIQVENDFITDIPDRNKLCNGQTPQGFKRSVIERAYEIALKDSMFRATDDCGVVKKYLPVEEIFVVEGEQQNIKLTTKEDLYLLDKLFQVQSADLSKQYSEDDVFDAFRNKVVVIFGGSYGIGKDIADELRRYTKSVHSFSRSETGTDISKYTDVQKALTGVYSETGKIDFIINTAALLKKQPLNSMTIEEIGSLVNVNYLGTLHLLNCAYPYLKESRGQVLLYTSSSYTRGRAMYSVYSSTKSALVNLTQALAEEWFEDGIKINCMNPERTKTPMRVSNFGVEPEETLLSSKHVAQKSIMALLSGVTGNVFDVKVGR